MKRFFQSTVIALFFSFALMWASLVGASTNLTYTYDANGNLTQGDGKYFKYNDANKLVEIRLNDKNGPVIAQYFYDHSGQRIKKTENGVVTYYIGKHFFWDHEVPGTCQNLNKIADNFSDFLMSIRKFDIEDIELKEEDIEDVWVNPNFIFDK